MFYKQNINSKTIREKIDTLKRVELKISVWEKMLRKIKRQINCKKSATFITDKNLLP